jgi:hypothetical protein
MQIRHGHRSRRSRCMRGSDLARGVRYAADSSTHRRVFAFLHAGDRVVAPQTGSGYRGSMSYETSGQKVVAEKWSWRALSPWTEPPLVIPIILILLIAGYVLFYGAN